jgi:predicted short-subunit dehydrogenase-like oxidoreductase (DUF2520 family)
VPTIRIIGPGRAGRSLAHALAGSGWSVLPLLGRGDDLAEAASGADALVLAVPDDAIAEVARSVRPVPTTPIVHLAGSLGPDVLSPHARRAALHPLVALPDPETGAARLRSGITFAVSGDPVGAEIAESLGGTAVQLPDDARAAYHAAASVAANHVVALLGQVQRIAGTAGLPLEAFLPLARAAVEDAGKHGPRQALTGPAARGDWQTLARHLAAIPEAERAAYRAGVGLALQLTVGPDGRRVEARGGGDGEPGAQAESDAEATPAPAPAQAPAPAPAAWAART